MRKIIKTDQAPAPIGAYNQAILSNGILYTSGQIAMDAKSGALVTDNIQQETEVVMSNLKAILEAAKLNFSNVVKASIFLSDMENFTLVNEVYSRYFNEETAPARECVQVAALPKYVNVEISVIAVEN
jgi:2-iminobutanoate/2-iminopropanoate deaminase